MTTTNLLKELRALYATALEIEITEVFYQKNRSVEDAQKIKQLKLEYNTKLTSFKELQL